VVVVGGGLVVVVVVETAGLWWSHGVTLSLSTCCSSLQTLPWWSWPHHPIPLGYVEFGSPSDCAVDVDPLPLEPARVLAPELGR